MLTIAIHSIKLFHHFHQLIIAVHDRIVENLANGLLTLANNQLKLFLLLDHLHDLLIFLLQLIVLLLHFLVLFLVV